MGVGTGVGASITVGDTWDICVGRTMESGQGGEPREHKDKLKANK